MSLKEMSFVELLKLKSSVDVELLLRMLPFVVGAIVLAIIITWRVGKKMKTLRKQTKSEVLLNLFEEIGTKIRVDDVCSITGIKNKNTLRSFCHYIRTSKHVAEENRIDIRISDGECIRVN